MEISSLLLRRLSTDFLRVKLTLNLPADFQNVPARNFKRSTLLGQVKKGFVLLKAPCSLHESTNISVMFLSGAFVSKKAAEAETSPRPRKHLLESFMHCCPCLKRKKLDAPLVHEDHSSYSISVNSPGDSALEPEGERLLLIHKEKTNEQDSSEKSVKNFGPFFPPFKSKFLKELVQSDSKELLQNGDVQMHHVSAANVGTSEAVEKSETLFTSFEDDHVPHPLSHSLKNLAQPDGKDPPQDGGEQMHDIPTALVKISEMVENSETLFTSLKDDQVPLPLSNSLKELALPNGKELPRDGDEKMQAISEVHVDFIKELPLLDEINAAAFSSQKDEAPGAELTSSPQKDFESKRKKEKSSKKKKKKGDDTGQHRPNYFVGVQVSSPQITTVVSSIQEHVLTQEPRLRKSAIPVATLHLTLLAFHAGHDDALDAACTAFLEAFPPSMLTSPLHLAFSGLGHFRNQVLFGKLQEGEDRLATLAQAVQSSFSRNGISHVDKSTFTPHLTIFKLSRDPKLRKQGVKQISPHLYEQFKDKELGSLHITSLQLLSMMDKKDSQGYYQKISELPFQADDPKNKKIREECQKAKEDIRSRISSLVSSSLTHSDDKKDS